MTSDLPLLTIGFLSWNRLHYLRATLESAHRCIKYPNIQWIVLDNCSTEPGLAEYLKSLKWVDELIFLESDHVTAMNEIISRAKGEILLLWPDDMQFIVEGDWMVDCVEVLLKNKWIGGMGLNSLRRSTIQRIWGSQPISLKSIKAVWSEIKRFGLNFRFQRKMYSSRKASFYSYGWKEDGIIGAGITSLSLIDVWKTLGPWKAHVDANIVDSSRGGETEMLNRWLGMRIPWQRALPTLPVSADILTDPTGTKAKVRSNIRYGVYTPPKQEFYYQIHEQEKLFDSFIDSLPLAFEDFVKPIGFELPVDQDGNLLKNSINTDVSTPVK